VQEEKKQEKNELKNMKREAKIWKYINKKKGRSYGAKIGQARNKGGVLWILERMEIEERGVVEENNRK